MFRCIFIQSCHDGFVVQLYIFLLFLYFFFYFKLTWNNMISMSSTGNGSCKRPTIPLLDQTAYVFGSDGIQKPPGEYLFISTIQFTSIAYFGFLRWPAFEAYFTSVHFTLELCRLKELLIAVKRRVNRRFDLKIIKKLIPEWAV